MLFADRLTLASLVKSQEVVDERSCVGMSEGNTQTRLHHD